MSKKIITDALHSPSLVGELKDYHKNMVNSVAKRGLLVFLSAIFVVLQYTNTALPSSSTNSTSEKSDLVYGGFESKQGALVEYDAAGSLLRYGLDTVSISRTDLINTSESSLSKWAVSHPGLVVSWSRSPIYKINLNENQPTGSLSFLATNKSGSFLYYGHAVDSASLAHIDSKVVHGHSDISNDFAILEDSGNILTTSYLADTCYKIPDETLSYVNCSNGNTFKSQTYVTNLSYKTNAKYMRNHPGDRLQYAVELLNKGQKTITFSPNIYLGDVLEYSKIIDVDMARFDESNKTLQWPKTSIKPGQQKTFTFVVQILDPVPIIASGATNAASYDCYMSSLVGNITNIKVLCPTPKIAEKQLSKPPDSSILALAWLILIFNILIYLRVYIFSKEHELILKSIGRKHD